MKLSCLCFFVFFSIVTKNILAQGYKFSFGNPSIKELKENSFSRDSLTDAAYIYKSCFNQISYKEGSFVSETVYNTRLKIYTKKGVSIATDSILLYLGQKQIDKLENISVVTCNWIDGKLKKYTLPKEEIKKVHRSNNLVVIIYTPIALQPGCIVDIKYSISSPFLYDLPPWFFQSSIPTAHSSYTLAHPEFIDFDISTQGLIGITRDKQTRTSNFDLTSNLPKNQYTELVHTLSVNNSPAFHDEPYISSRKNYISHSNITIKGHNLPGQYQMRNAYSWQNIKEWIMSKHLFGEQLDNQNFITQDITDLIAGIEDSLDIALAVIKHIRQKVKWNGTYQLLCEKPIKSSYQEGIGNSTEINLLLILGLRAAGLDAFPVVLNHRKDGIVNILQPSVRAFNYAITGFLAKGKNYLIDAAALHYAPNVLPSRCINASGLWLGKTTEWVDLSSLPSNESFISQLSLNLDNEISGTLKHVAKHYAGTRWRQRLAVEGSNKKLLRDIDWDNDRLKVNGGKVSGFKPLNAPISLEMKVELRNSLIEDDNLIYIEPVYTGRIKENPFKANSRMNPIEFTRPIKQSFVLTLDIPEGYLVENLPQAEIVKLPNKAGKFSYNALAMGQKIQIICSYTINNTFFPNKDYDALKQFFDAIIRKQEEPIVLKKK